MLSENKGLIRGNGSNSDARTDAPNNKEPLPVDFGPREDLTAESARDRSTHRRMRDSTFDSSFAAVREDARPSSVSFLGVPLEQLPQATDGRRARESLQTPNSRQRQDMARSINISQDHHVSQSPHALYTTERIVDMPYASTRSSLLHQREPIVHHTVINGQPQQTSSLPMSALTGGPVVYQTARIASERVYKREMHGFKVITVEDYDLLISLRVKNKELEEQIKQLESQSTSNSSQQTIYSELTNERNRIYREYKEELASLESKLKTAEAANEEVGKQLSMQSTAASSLKEKLAELEKNIKQLKSDNMKLLAENEALTRDKNTAELTIRRQMIELASSSHSPSLQSSEILRKLKADENGKISDLEIRLLEQEGLLSKTLREKREIQDHSFQHSSAMMHSNQKPAAFEDHEELISMHNKLSKLTRQLKEKTQLIEEQQIRLDTLEAQNRNHFERHQQAAVQFDSRLANNKKQLIEKDGLISELETSLSGLKRKLADCQSQLREEKDRSVNASVLAESLKTNSIASEEQLDALAKKNKTLSQEIKSSEQKIQLLDAANLDLHKQNANLKGEIFLLEEDKRSRASRHADLKRQLQSKEEETLELESTCATQKAKIAELEKRNSLLDNDIKLLSNEIERMNLIVDSKEQEESEKQEDQDAGITRDQLIDMLKEAEEKVASMDSQLTQYEERIMEFESRETELADLCDKYVYDNTKLQEQVSKLKTDSENKYISNGVSSEHIDSLVRMVRALHPDSRKRTGKQS